MMRTSGVNKIDFELAPDPELVAEGWERRFMADPVRARESVELYESLGYEVLTEPVKPVELPEACTDCRVVVYFSFVNVYTRKVTTQPGFKLDADERR
jgi:hypothetical protein